MTDTEREQAPPPLVPPEVDLRGLEYMPLFGLHLFGSEFNASCSDAEWRAGVTLWWAAWNQQPAGSLPNDDVALCRLADLGRDVKLWRRLKANALRGFVLCSDGRLYHAFLCQQVLVAWKKRVQERERKRSWREKKMGQNADGDGDKTRTGTGTETGTERGRNADVPADVTGRDVTGRDVKAEARSEPPVQPAPAPTRTGAACALLRGLGVNVTPADPRLLGWLGLGATDEQLREAVERARLNKPPPDRIPAAYLDPIVREVVAGPTPRANGHAEPAWWGSESATIAKGEQIGVRARPGEEMHAYRQRIREAIAKQAAA